MASAHERGQFNPLKRVYSMIYKAKKNKRVSG